MFIYSVLWNKKENKESVMDKEKAFDNDRGWEKLSIREKIDSLFVSNMTKA